MLYGFLRGLSLKTLGIFVVIMSLLVAVFGIVLFAIGETAGGWTLLAIIAGCYAMIGLGAWVGRHRRSSAQRSEEK